MKITSIIPLVVNVSEKTNWFFVRVETDAGISGLGEATLSGGWESVQHTCLQRLSAKLVGKEVEHELPGLQVYPHSPGGLAWNSELSAVEQALIDICARHAGVPVHALFGKPLRSSVRVYANINRMTRDRSPTGFARNASAKVAEGYTAVKIAPFGKLLDVVMPDVKYAGGYAETLRIAERAAKAGIAYSPHNPTGPVCTFASLHLCALAPNFLILERQSETSIYDDIIVGSHPALVNGCYAIPEGPGLGIDLNPDVLSAHPYQPPSVESLSDPRLG